MSLLEVLMGFLAGMILIFCAAFIFKLKVRTEARLILNSLLGLFTLAALNFFSIASIPINLFNAFFIGFTGVPGIILIYIILII